MEHTALLLYIPALHEGYIKLFHKYAGRADILYILGSDLSDEFPILEREIRAMQPETVQKLLVGAGYFPHVEIIDHVDLPKLADDKNCQLVMTDEFISEELRKKYFPDKPVIIESVFLRYDENIVKNARKEVEFTGTVTEDEFHEKIMALADKEKEKNSEWFLRVGAALVLNDPLQTRFDYNHRLPTPQSPWMVGDVRMYVPYGTDTHIRTTLHAEQAILAHAARDGVKVEGASLYVTTFPCPDCCNNIAEAGIKRIYFKEGYSHLSSTDALEAYKIEVIKVL